MLRKFNILLLFLFLISFACRKDDSVTVHYELIETGENSSIHKLLFLNDSVGYACGGKQFGSGFILKTTNHGYSWEKVFYSSSRCIYDLHFINDKEGYAGGDSMLMLTTKDGGNNWLDFWFDTIPRHKFQRTAFKQFFFLSDKEFFITGGQNFDAGLLYKTTDAGENWIFHVFENEMKAIYFPDFLNGFISGNGVIYKTTDGGNSCQLCPIKGDFFTSLYFTDHQNGIASGFNGGIYKTNDAGNKWKTIIKPNRVFEKRTHINDMKFADNINGYAAGPDGLLIFTDDGGNTWKQVKKFTDDMLLSILVIKKGELFITTNHGIIYRLLF